MTRSKLIARLAEMRPYLTHNDIELAVKTLLNAMSDTLARGRRIEIRGFGSFGLSLLPPRMGRNPKTGESVSIPAKYVPRFRVGKELRQRVDY